MLHHLAVFTLSGAVVGLLVHVAGLDSHSDELVVHLRMEVDILPVLVEVGRDVVGTGVCERQSAADVLASGGGRYRVGVGHSRAIKVLDVVFLRCKRVGRVAVVAVEKLAPVLHGLARHLRSPAGFGAAVIGSGRSLAVNVLVVVGRIDGRDVQRAVVFQSERLSAAAFLRRDDDGAILRA